MIGVGVTCSQPKGVKLCIFCQLLYTSVKILCDFRQENPSGDIGDGDEWGDSDEWEYEYYYEDEEEEEQTQETTQKVGAVVETSKSTGEG